MSKLKLKERIPIETEPFSLLESEYTTAPDWLTDTDSLNRQYLYLHSGNKTESPYITALAEANDLEEDDELTVAVMTIVMNDIYNRFHDKWDHIWSTITAEYNPIENYNLSESETTSYAASQSGSESNTSSDTSKTNTHLVTNNSGSQDNAVYSFNSTGANPVGIVENDNLQSVSGDKDDNYTESSASLSKQSSGSESNNGSRSLTRTGNIGIQTAADMAMKELELRRYDFLNTVFDDCDRIIALQIYN